MRPTNLLAHYTILGWLVPNWGADTLTIRKKPMLNVTALYVVKKGQPGTHDALLSNQLQVVAGPFWSRSDAESAWAKFSLYSKKGADAYDIKRLTFTAVEVS